MAVPFHHNNKYTGFYLIASQLVVDKKSVDLSIKVDSLRILGDSLGNYLDKSITDNNPYYKHRN